MQVQRVGRPAVRYEPCASWPRFSGEGRASMTERYLVMPRGINVGTRNRVPMAELRSKLTGDGYWDVATVLQSGNVIVSTEQDRPDEVAGAVQRLLSDEFDVDVACVVRTAKQVRGVLERNPLQEVVSDASRYLVVFLSPEPDPEAVEGAAGGGPQPRGHRDRRCRGIRLDSRWRQGDDPVVCVPREAVRRRRHGAQLEHP